MELPPISICREYVQFQNDYLATSWGEMDPMDRVAPITASITDLERWDYDAIQQCARSIFDHGRPDPVHWVIVAYYSDAGSIRTVAFAVAFSDPA
eukprot:2065090-Alexandrium_andersonii.AAC.1